MSENQAPQDDKGLLLSGFLMYWGLAIGWSVVWLFLMLSFRTTSNWWIVGWVVFPAVWTAALAIRLKPRTRAGMVIGLFSGYALGLLLWSICK
jgi:hypothetical protein